MGKRRALLRDRLYRGWGSREVSRVQGKVAIVTGAAHGLGEAIAIRLAEEGAKLVLGDIDGEALKDTVAAVEATGSSALSVVGDITEEVFARRLVETLPGSTRLPRP